MNISSESILLLKHLTVSVRPITTPLELVMIHTINYSRMLRHSFIDSGTYEYMCNLCIGGELKVTSVTELLFNACSEKIYSKEIKKTICYNI